MSTVSKNASNQLLLGAKYPEGINKSMPGHRLQDTAGWAVLCM